MTVHFAVLAHNKPACLLDQIANLREASPGCEVSLFNGGPDASFGRDAGVPVNPRSRHLRYGNLTPYHFATMRWLVETKAPFDHLVFLDSDALALRPGLSEHLDALLVGDHAYAGARFRTADRPDTWDLGGTTVGEVNEHWQRWWRPLLGDVPHWSFNPGQVLRRDLVERAVAWDRFDELARFAARSATWAIEEIVIPTLAVRLGGGPLPLPGEAALVYGSHSIRELVDLAAQPDVHLVHKVGMSLDAADRVAVHHLLRGEAVPAALLDVPASPMPTPPRLSIRHRLERKARHLWLDARS